MLELPAVNFKCYLTKSKILLRGYGTQLFGLVQWYHDFFYRHLSLLGLIVTKLTILLLFVQCLYGVKHTKLGWKPWFKWQDPNICMWHWHCEQVSMLMLAICSKHLYATVVLQGDAAGLLNMVSRKTCFPHYYANACTKRFLNIIGFSHLQTQKAPWQHAHQVSWCTKDCCVIQINSLILPQTSNIDNNPFSLLSRSTSGLYIAAEYQKQVCCCPLSSRNHLALSGERATGTSRPNTTPSATAIG